MLKYGTVEGFTVVGEVMHHIYEWFENESEKEFPDIILVNAYEREPVAWKGVLLNKTKQFIPTPVKENELADLEKIVGKIKVYEDFNDFNEVTNVAPNTVFVRLEK